MASIVNQLSSFDAALQPDPFDINRVCDQIFRDGFAYITDLFPQALLLDLYKEIQQLDKNYELQLAGIGRGEDHVLHETIRSDKIKWIDGKSLAQALFQERLEQFRLQINQYLMLGLFDVESNFAVYRKGDFYKRHFDSFVGEKNRLLSMVTYLNPQWDASNGGLLHAYKDGKTTQAFAEIVPIWGHVVIFLSEKISHEVTATNHTRYSIATWFRCNNMNPLL